MIMSTVEKYILIITIDISIVTSSLKYDILLTQNLLNKIDTFVALYRSIYYFNRETYDISVRKTNFHRMIWFTSLTLIIVIAVALNTIFPNVSSSIFIHVEERLIRIIPKKILSVVRECHSTSSRVNSSVDETVGIRTRSSFHLDNNFWVFGNRDHCCSIDYRITNPD